MQDLAALAAQREREVQERQGLQEELEGLRGRLEATQRREGPAAQDRLALAQQLEASSEQLAQQQRQVAALEADQRRLQQEGNGLRQLNGLLAQRVSSAVQRAASANESSALLAARLATAERERDAARALVDIERRRAGQMVHVAEAARVQAASKDIQLQRMRLGHRDPDSLASTGPEALSNLTSPSTQEVVGDS